MVSSPPPTISTQRLGWSVLKTPMFKSREQVSISSRKLELVDQPFAMYQWTLTWEILADGRGGLNELRYLMSFFNTMQGKAGTFLYLDPTDNSVTGQTIGTGDGANDTFYFARQLYTGGAADPIECASETGCKIYVNGVLQSALRYSFLETYTGLAYAIKFGAPYIPGAGTTITADFTYSWQCHFMDDGNEFENFAYQLWALKTLKFEQRIGLVPN